jgi:hypothetical protein
MKRIVVLVFAAIWVFGFIGPAFAGGHSHGYSSGDMWAAGAIGFGVGALAGFAGGSAAASRPSAPPAYYAPPSPVYYYSQRPTVIYVQPTAQSQQSYSDNSWDRSNQGSRGGQWRQQQQSDSSSDEPVNCFLYPEGRQQNSCLQGQRDRAKRIQTENASRNALEERRLSREAYDAGWRGYVRNSND